MSLSLSVWQSCTCSPGKQITHTETSYTYLQCYWFWNTCTDDQWYQLLLLFQTYWSAATQPQGKLPVWMLQEVHSKKKKRKNLYCSPRQGDPLDYRDRLKMSASAMSVTHPSVLELCGPVWAVLTRSRMIVHSIWMSHPFWNQRIWITHFLEKNKVRVLSRHFQFFPIIHPTTHLNMSLTNSQVFINVSNSLI